MSEEDSQNPIIQKKILSILPPEQELNLFTSNVKLFSSKQPLPKIKIIQKLDI